MTLNQRSTNWFSSFYHIILSQAALFCVLRSNAYTFCTYKYIRNVRFNNEVIVTLNFEFEWCYWMNFIANKLIWSGNHPAKKWDQNQLFRLNIVEYLFFSETAMQSRYVYKEFTVQVLNRPTSSISMTEVRIRLVRLTFWTEFWYWENWIKVISK